MRRLIAAVLCTIIPTVVFASDNGYNVTYDGGSITETKAGTGLKMYIEANQVRFVKDNKDVATIPASAVTEISYGQDVHRRVGTAVAIGRFTLGLWALTVLSK